MFNFKKDERYDKAIEIIVYELNFRYRKYKELMKEAENPKNSKILKGILLDGSDEYLKEHIVINELLTKIRSEIEGL